MSNTGDREIPTDVDRKKRRMTWTPAFVLLATIVCVVIGRSIIDALKEKPQPKASPPEIKLPPKPEEVAKPHLDRAATESKRIIDEHVKIIDTFFADAKKGTHAFAGEALGWSSKWRLVVDYVPFTSGERHKTYLKNSFEERIFRADKLEEVVKQVVKSYMDHLRSIEGKMLVELRTDVSDFPSAFPIAGLDEKRLSETFEQALKKAADATGGVVQINITSEVVSSIAGNVLARRQSLGKRSSTSRRSSVRKWLRSVPKR